MVSEASVGLQSVLVEVQKVLVGGVSCMFSLTSLIPSRLVGIHNIYRMVLRLKLRGRRNGLVFHRTISGELPGSSGLLILLLHKIKV